MLVKTLGVVLKTVNYTESSIIVQIFTRDFGMQSYMVRGARKPKAKIGKVLFQPLTLLNLVAYHKANGGIQHLSEVKQEVLLNGIYNNISKQSLAFFLNEVVFKILSNHDKDEHIFDFLHHAILYLNQCPKQQIANFHLQFLSTFIKHLGFKADTNALNNFNSYFDLMQGVAIAQPPVHPHFIAHPESLFWKHIFETPLTQNLNITIGASDRKKMLSYLIEFYQLHLEHFGKINSLDVFKEVFE